MNHDDMCPGCAYQRRREINGVGARITDYRVTCSKCGGAILGEMEHVIESQTFCSVCAQEKEHNSATS